MNRTIQNSRLRRILGGIVERLKRKSRRFDEEGVEFHRPYLGNDYALAAQALREAAAVIARHLPIA